MMTEDKKLEIFYDHYKDTFEYQIKYIENRNRYFFIALTLIALLFFLITDPTTVNNAVGSFVEKQVGKNLVFDFAYVNNFLLFGLLWVLILYYQTTLTIEKQYKYIGILEEELSKLLEPLTISREGKFYLKVKPTFSKWVSKIYKLFFPLSIAIAVFIKLIIEIVYEQRIEKLSFWVDFVLCFVIIAITLLFTFWQNWERKQK
jgi:hypothetical protein